MSASIKWLVAECVKHFGQTTKAGRKAALESLDGFRYDKTLKLYTEPNIALKH